MRNILIVIDVLFNFAYAISVHFKDAKAITAAFGQVLIVENPRHPRRLQTDKGEECFDSNYCILLNRHGIQNFAS